MEYQFEIRSDNTVYFTTARNYAEAIKFFKMSCGDLPIDYARIIGEGIRDNCIADTLWENYLDSIS